MKPSYKSKFIFELQRLSISFSMESYEHTWSVNGCNLCAILNVTSHNTSNCQYCPLSVISGYHVNDRLKGYAYTFLCTFPKMLTNKQISNMLVKAMPLLESLPSRYYTPSGFNKKVFKEIYKLVK